MHHYKNPWENSISERIHQCFGSMLNTEDLANIIFDTVYLRATFLTLLRMQYDAHIKARYKLPLTS